MIKTLEKAYVNACLGEIQALKPGNVHIFADGHHMEVMHFVKSAEVSAAPLCKSESSVGQRILEAVAATQQAVNMNTNLGIILLCAPLIHARLTIGSQIELSLSHLQAALKTTLSSLTTADGQAAAQAIVFASPAGLGEAAEMDVNKNPDGTLLQMMQLASNHDHIAWQYANDYALIFDEALPIYQAGVAQWNGAWATSWVYLYYLSNHLDSHVARKYGHAIARQVQNEAKEMCKKWHQAGHPKLIKGELLQWDKSLKERQYNPGTSADLTVATLLIEALSKSL